LQKAKQRPQNLRTVEFLNMLN